MEQRELEDSGGLSRGKFFDDTRIFGMVLSVLALTASALGGVAYLLAAGWIDSYKSSMESHQKQLTSQWTLLQERGDKIKDLQTRLTDNDKMTTELMEDVRNIQLEAASRGWKLGRR